MYAFAADEVEDLAKSVWGGVRPVPSAKETPMFVDQFKQFAAYNKWAKRTSLCRSA